MNSKTEKTFLDWIKHLENIKCHICGDINEEEWICEKCDQVYCENCSADFTYHSPIDFNCCEDCANIDYRNYE